MAIFNSQSNYLLKVEDNQKSILGYCKVSPILPSNTKARRLGYISMILNLFERTDYYPVIHFPQKIEQEVEPLNNYLSIYKNNKGVISKSKKIGAFTGTSAKPYLDLTENLSLIIEVNKAYILTKQGKVYRALNRQIEAEQLLPQTDNPFVLNLFQKSFFIHQILTKDALYFWSLLEIINEQQDRWIDEIKDNFRQHILDELHQQLDSPRLSNLDKQKILQIHQRIRNWKKADKYLPHIVEPRINWFLDLELLDTEAFQSRKLKFSEAGIRLFEILRHFYHYFQEKSTIIEFIVEYYFFQLINRVYSINLNRNYHDSLEHIVPYIEESFKSFKTMAPNSISAYQAIYYSCYKFLLKDKDIVEFIEIKNFLEENQNTDFTLDWYPKEYDGSLQKRR